MFSVCVRVCARTHTRTVDTVKILNKNSENDKFAYGMRVRGVHVFN